MNDGYTPRCSGESSYQPGAHLRSYWFRSAHSAPLPIHRHFGLSTCFQTPAVPGTDSQAAFKGRHWTSTVAASADAGGPVLTGSVTRLQYGLSYPSSPTSCKHFCMENFQLLLFPLQYFLTRANKKQH